MKAFIAALWSHSQVKSNSKQKEQNIIKVTLCMPSLQILSYLPAAKAIQQFEYLQGQKQKVCFLLHGGVLYLFIAVYCRKSSILSVPSTHGVWELQLERDFLKDAILLSQPCVNQVSYKTSKNLFGYFNVITV